MIESWKSHVKFGAKHEIDSLDRQWRGRYFPGLHILVSELLVEQSRRVGEGRYTSFFFCGHFLAN